MENLRKDKIEKKNIFDFIINNNINKVKEWLNLYHNDINNKYDDGIYILYITCWEGYLEIAKLLIENGADVNIKNNDDYTPLHYACSNKHLDIVELLIEKGADVNIKNNDGRTPLDYLNDNEKQLITQLI